MADGTLNSFKEAPLCGNVALKLVKVTAPSSGSTQTSFTIPIDKVSVGDYVFLNPTDAGARALTAVGGVITSAGVLTIYHTSATHASQTFDVLIGMVR
jgi:hypothetical protein